MLRHTSLSFQKENATLQYYGRVEDYRSLFFGPNATHDRIVPDYDVL
jgi:hypothetical protein